jgi:surface protein
MDKNYNVIGVFEKRNYPLMVTVVGQGSVQERVISSKQTADYPFQTLVELTPVPAIGWEFKEWAGDLTGNQTPASISINGNKTVTARFQRKNYPLAIIIEGDGTVQERVVTTKPTADYPYQTVVELTPIPATGWEFKEWASDLTGSQVPNTITINSNKTVTVRFQKKNYPLNVTIVGQGTVKERVISAKPSADYPYQTTVELTPVANAGWKFESWSGDLTGNQIPKTITLNAAKSVTATFIQIAFLDENGVTIRCPNGKVGDIGLVDGVEYEVVDRARLIQYRDQGKDLTKVCTSLVTDMSNLFYGKLFNQAIGNWDVSSVTNMASMFFESIFNQDISNWNVGKVTNMSSMFRNTPFSHAVSKWNVSSVRDMNHMFGYSNFNYDLNEWNVSSVTYMNNMFEGSKFNKPLSKWHVGNVRSMANMFHETPFNQAIGNWDVSSVTNMASMFFESKFDQDISDWNVGKVVDMSSMFRNSPFSYPVSKWNVSSVRDMNHMFGYTNYNHNLNDWDVSSVAYMNNMFQGSKFNKPINSWNVSNVRSMANMFHNTPFNQPLSAWNVKNVTNMSSMFQNSLFNQPINNWCVSQINIEPSNFSTGSPLTTQNKPLWGTCATILKTH